VGARANITLPPFVLIPNSSNRAVFESICSGFNIEILELRLAGGVFEPLGSHRFVAKASFGDDLTSVYYWLSAMRNEIKEQGSKT
jgi:hypothetical protein